MRTEIHELQVILEEALEKMGKTISVFKEQLASIRTGRANADMLNGIKVDNYGNLVPINEVATINIPDALLITINIWDKNNISSVESALRNANLGMNPEVDGTIIKLRVPSLTEERRKDLASKAKELGEESKIALRQIRQDFFTKLRKLEKDKVLSEDEIHTHSHHFEKEVKTFVEEVDHLVESKANQIKTI